MENTLRVLENGSVVLMTPQQVPVPLFCPLCEHPMRSQGDAVSFRELNCCQYCDLKFRGILKSGTLPIKETPEWSSYMDFRKQKSKKKIHLK